ncbi:hypothetical protein ACLB2K_033221 [Fragaria x ananassa]
MVAALVLMLLDKLASVTYEYTEKEVRLVLDVKKEVEEFTGNLEAIQAVLEDAEQKQVKHASVRNWVILRRDIALKIKDLNDKLTVIANQRQAYNLQSIERIAEQPERQKSSSFVDISKVFGRENEKDGLISRLFSESSQEERALLVIPIIGMGGVGKTTLAQLVYNDENVKAHFEKRIWVCVSDHFDEIKIAKAIADGNGISNSNELEAVLQCMSKSIEGKNFLLVLDDVWTQDHTEWEQLELPLMQNCGEGSRIIVTTRKEEVAIMMEATTHMMPLKQLSMQNCLSLFNHIAFLGKKEDESTVFRAIGEGIVKKCKGLPLAAKTLASLMCYKKMVKEWQDVLVNILIELWMSQDYLHSKGNHEKEVLVAHRERMFHYGVVWCKQHNRATTE